MRKIILTVLAGLFLSNAQANVLVRSAEVVGDDLNVVVSYGGGCEEHKFELKVNQCMESNPVQCPISIIDVSDKPDFCEAYITEELSFSLKEEELNDSYYSGASLYFNYNTDSQVDVKLPKVGGEREFEVPVNSAEIIGDLLKVNVTYGGGCEEHKFEVRIESCMESYPVQCPVKVIDVSEKPDYCRALIRKELSFSIDELGLNDSYYNGAALYFNWRADNMITVRLPFL